MAADGSVIISIDADGKLAIKEIDNTSEKIGELGAKSENTNKDLTKLAAGAAAVSAAMIALGKEAVEAATKFEAAFARTQTIMDETEMSVNGMRSSILKLSQDSAMAATDVSDAVYNAISGSVSTKDAVDFVDQANKLSVAGFTSLASATDIMTTTLNAYGLSADKVGGISNVLISTQNLGKTTVNELSESMGRAISTASAYGVDLQNLSTAYVELTRGGVQTRMATTYLSGMFNELGDAGSKVGKLLAEQTGSSFGQLMAQGWSLGDVLQVLSNTVNGNAEAMMGLWGSQEAGKAANAIMTQSVEDFNAVLSQMNQEMAGTTGTTEKAYETMTHTSEFIDQRLSNSVTNLGIAFGDGLNPALNDVKSFLADVIEGFTEFLNNHPAVKAAITGLAVGVTAAAIALSVYTIGTKLATSATLKLTAAMATNPIFLAIMAVTALFTAVAIYASTTDEAVDETEELTAASKKQRQEVEKLTEEYNAVCEAEGETSAAAIELKAKIDDATAAYEDSKQTVDEFREAHEKLTDELAQKKESYDSAVDSLNDEYAGTVNLIERLNELTTAEEQSAAAKEEIAAIVDILNGKYPDLALTYDKLTGILSMTPDEIATAAAAEYRSETAKTKFARLGEIEGYLLQQAEDDYQKQTAQQTEAHEKYIYYEYPVKKYNHRTDTDNWTHDTIHDTYTHNETGETLYWADLTRKKDEAYDAYLVEMEKTSTAQDAYDALLIERNQLKNELSDMYKEEADSHEGVSGAVETLKSSLSDLTASYIAAYDAAKESMQGQYKLWDDVAAVSATSVSSMIESQQKQAEYWTNYKSNIETLLSYSGDIPGLSEMVASFADGSANSVNAIAGMAASLAEGDTGALETLVSDWQTTQQAIDDASTALGDLETGYSDTVDAITKEFKGVLEGLEISSDAQTVATEAVSAYAQAILDNKDNAVSAASELASAVADALGTTITVTVTASSGGVAPNSGYIPQFDILHDGYTAQHGYADGTINAKRGATMVGEHGPELVFMNGGEQVITAAETRRMLAESYPIAPEMQTMPGGVPAAVGRTGGAQISTIITVPLAIDGREFARATAEYIGEEMDFEVM